jgi:hypothetical protein
MVPAFPMAFRRLDRLEGGPLIRRGRGKEGEHLGCGCCTRESCNCSFEVSIPLLLGGARSRPGFDGDNTLWQRRGLEEPVSVVIAVPPSLTCLPPSRPSRGGARPPPTYVTSKATATALTETKPTDQPLTVARHVVPGSSFDCENVRRESRRRGALVKVPALRPLRATLRESCPPSKLIRHGVRGGGTTVCPSSAGVRTGRGNSIRFGVGTRHRL